MFKEEFLESAPYITTFCLPHRKRIHSFICWRLAVLGLYTLSCDSWLNLWNQHSYSHFMKGELKEVQKDALVFLEEVTVEVHVMITKPLPFPLNHYFIVILIFLFYHTMYDSLFTYFLEFLYMTLEKLFPSSCVNHSTRPCCL